MDHFVNTFLQLGSSTAIQMPIYLTEFVERHHIIFDIGRPLPCHRIDHRGERGAPQKIIRLSKLAAYTGCPTKVGRLGDQSLF